MERQYENQQNLATASNVPVNVNSLAAASIAGLAQLIRIHTIFSIAQYIIYPHYI